MNFLKIYLIKVLFITLSYSYSINYNKKYVRNTTEQINNTTDVITSYYGDQLNSFEREIYDRLQEEFESDDSYYRYVIYDISSGEDYSADEISRACFRASCSLIMDNPEYFWLGNGSKQLISYESGNIKKLEITFEKNYEESEINGMKNEINIVIDEVLNEVNKRNTTCDKVKYIHDFLVKSIKYDDTENNSRFNIYGSLVDKLCVCEGYAEAFTYLSQKANITAITVNSQLHEWNYVRMDNNKWYAMDVTYDDPQIGNIRYESGNDRNKKYDYFLIGTETYIYKNFQRMKYKDSSDHQVLDYLLLESATGFEYPELSETAYECKFSHGTSISVNYFVISLLIIFSILFIK